MYAVFFLGRTQMPRRTFITVVCYILACFFIMAGCGTDTTVAPEIKTPEELIFLSKFDRLFNEDIAEQSEEYKENIRQLILIHARDLLRQNKEDETAFDIIQVERFTYLRYPSENPDCYVEDSSFRSLGPLSDEKAEKLDKNKKQGLFHTWMFGIDKTYDNGGYYCPYYKPISVADGKVVKINICYQYNACGGLYSDCYTGWDAPTYITDADSKVFDELLKRLESITTLKHVEFNLFTGVDPAVDGFRSFFPKPGEPPCEYADFLKHARRIVLENQVQNTP